MNPDTLWAENVRQAREHLAQALSLIDHGLADGSVSNREAAEAIHEGAMLILQTVSVRAEEDSRRMEEVLRADKFQQN